MEYQITDQLLINCRRQCSYLNQLSCLDALHDRGLRWINNGIARYAYLDHMA